MQLVRQFCAAGEGDPRYLDELLALTAAFKNAEAVRLLADLALRFPDFPALAQETRWGVLAVLVDTPPSQTLDFWKAIGQQDSEQYASLVLSGLLALDPREAVQYLPKMPNTERSGQATALKLDLTWDELPSAQRAPFVEQITRILRQCSSPFAGPVQAWLASKPAPYPATPATNTTYPQPFVGSVQVCLASKLPYPATPATNTTYPQPFVGSVQVCLASKLPYPATLATNTTYPQPFASPVQAWLASKPAPYPATLATNTTYPQLIAALRSSLGPSEVEPRYRTAKLCEAA